MALVQKATFCGVGGQVQLHETAARFCHGPDKSRGPLTSSAEPRGAEEDCAEQASPEARAARSIMAGPNADAAMDPGGDAEAERCLLKANDAQQVVAGQGACVGRARCPEHGTPGG